MGRFRRRANLLMGKANPSLTEVVRLLGTSCARGENRKGFRRGVEQRHEKNTENDVGITPRGRNRNERASRKTVKIPDAQRDRRVCQR